MKRLFLVNPNADADVTAQMVGIAREEAGPAAAVSGFTAPSGPKLLTTEAALAGAAMLVAETVTPDLVASSDAVIVAAFGDPGRAALAAKLPIPVIGLAEAGMAEAARHGRFAVVTTTPSLVVSMTRTAALYGHAAALAGIFVTDGDPEVVMQCPARLLTALERACAEALSTGVAALVIGGGPLARAARGLRDRLPVPLVEPLPASVRLALLRTAGEDARRVEVETAMSLHPSPGPIRSWISS